MKFLFIPSSHVISGFSFGVNEIVTDISGQPIGPIFKGQIVLEPSPHLEGKKRRNYFRIYIRT